MPVSRSRVLNWGSAMRALLRVCREPRQENPGWLGIDGCKSSTQSPPLQRFEKGRIRKGEMGTLVLRSLSGACEDC